VYDRLSRNVPDFSGEKHWTSSLRTYANFPACEEGISDFEYEGDVTPLLYSFGIYNLPRTLTKVHIEVKSSGGDEKGFFHLSEAQFRYVNSNFSGIQADRSFKRFAPSPISCI
jgi:hypothetical protein